jgi:hypothetical protein
MAKRLKLMSLGFSSAQTEAMVGEAGSIALAGSTAADATIITSECTLIASGSGGAALPASDKGDTYLIKNESGNTATLYPSKTAGTVTINATTSLSMATAKSVIVFFTSPTACHTIPTVAT